MCTLKNCDSLKDVEYVCISYIASRRKQSLRIIWLHTEGGLISYEKLAKLPVKILMMKL